MLNHMLILPSIFAVLIVILITVFLSKRRTRKIYDLRWRLLALTDMCGCDNADRIFEEAYEASLIYGIEPAEFGYADFNDMQAEAVASMRLRRKRLARGYREIHARFMELYARKAWTDEESSEFKALRETVMRNGAELNAFCRKLDHFVCSSE